MLDPLVVEGRGRLDLVGLDAAHVEGLLRGQGLHQRLHRVLEGDHELNQRLHFQKTKSESGKGTKTHLEEGARRLRSLGDLGNFVGTLGPHRLEDLILRVEEEALEVLQWYK